MKQKRLISLLVLLMTVVTGAWAQEPATYKVTLQEGTEDATNWTVPAEAAAGSPVTATYNGTKKVKSVKAVKKGGIVCTASDLGKVLCTDGSIYENVSAATTAGKTAVAMIAYVDETNKNGLAIALADESGKMNWSTAKSTCEGKTAIAGVKWCLPSQDQWKQMFKANGGNDARYTGLNATITTAGGYALKESTDYWSSSEADPGAVAYRVNLDDSDADWYTGSEGSNRQVRACLAF